MIHVIAVITARPGMRDKVIEAFSENAPAVRAEKGCIEYIATVDAIKGRAQPENFGADAIIAIETWTDLAALLGHSQAPHMVAFGERIEPFVQAKVIHVLEPVRLA